MDGMARARRSTINHERLAALARPSVFAVFNAVTITLCRMQHAYGMKPAELQIFLLIGLAGVQRVLRDRPIPADIAGVQPVPIERLSGVSRRQLAELTGLSREAIRRTILKLMERGLVVEASRGALAQSPGCFQKMSGIIPVHELLTPFLDMLAELDRLGVVDLGERRRP